MITCILGRVVKTREVNLAMFYKDLYNHEITADVRLDVRLVNRCESREVPNMLLNFSAKQA